MTIYTRKNLPFGYYVYAYIRSKDSKTAKAGTPYYIGKGKGGRAWYHGKQEATQTPNNHRNIMILESNLTEIGAFALERRYIKWHGRVDTCIDGILRNLSDGGEGPSGRITTESHKKKIGESNKGKIVSEETRERQRGSKSERHKAAMRKPKSTTINMCVPKKKYTCSHCDKIVGGESNFNRWHGDNCTKNPISPSYGKKHIVSNNPFTGGEIQRAAWLRRKKKRLEKGILTRAEKRAILPKMDSTQIKWKCEQCSKSGKGSSNYSRWHGNNCRHKK